jgi:hypothetical protein
MCIPPPFIHVPKPYPQERTGREIMPATKGIAGATKTAYFEEDERRTAGAAPWERPGMAPAIHPVLIKQYAGLRFYRPAACSYVTLDDLAAMAEDHEEFIVAQAESGIDITSSILQQITGKRVLHG